jgi:hypothetical protein
MTTVYHPILNLNFKKIYFYFLKIFEFELSLSYGFGFQICGRKKYFQTEVSYYSIEKRIFYKMNHIFIL